MKKRNGFYCLIGAILLFGLITSGAACGGKAKNDSSSKADNSRPSVENKSGDYSNRDTNTTKDPTPVTVSANDIGGWDAEEKYKGRMLTVTDAKLSEIATNYVKVRHYLDSSLDSFYIICNGDFSEYASMSSKVQELEKEGKGIRVEIKGVFKSGAKQYVDYAELEPCVISDLKK